MLITLLKYQALRYIQYSECSVAKQKCSQQNSAADDSAQTLTGTQVELDATIRELISQYV